jgi:hypothetical protein
MALPKYRSFLGVAKEATRANGAVPIPVAATDFIPCKNITPFDNIKYLADEGWRGSMVSNYGEVQGPIYSEFEFGGDVFADTIGYPLAGVLGDYAITGASTPYTHTMAVKNSGTGQATSYTLTDYNAIDARQFSGVQFGSFGLKFSAENLLEYTAMGNGYQSAGSATITTATGAAGTVTYTAVNNFYVGQIVTITGNSLAALNLTAQTIVTASATQFTVSNAATGTGTGGTAAVVIPTTSYTAVPPSAVWYGTTTIASSLTAKLAEGDLNIKRTLTPIHTVDGSQTPYQIFQGPVEVDGTLKLIMEDNTDINRYLQNTQPSLVLNWTQGTGAALTQIQFTLSKCAFTVAKVDRSKDFVEVDINFIGVSNTNDIGASGGYSPVKVILQNAKSTAVYA